MQNTQDPQADLVEVYLIGRFAHLPSWFRVSHDERVLWEVTDPKQASEYMGKTTLDLADEGVELIIEVEWPEGTPHSAVELVLEPDALEGKGVTLWGTGRIDEIATYRW